MLGGYLNRVAYGVGGLNMAWFRFHCCSFCFFSAGSTSFKLVCLQGAQVQQQKP